jgi:signal transduction histidine kinase
MTETERAERRSFGFGRDGARSNGRSDDPQATATQANRPELVDFRVPALRRQLDAAQRAAAAGDADRERLGQDLHDGVQQRLTALRIRLSLAAAEFDGRGDRAASAVLTDFGDEVDGAIDELRAFAHGVYPAVLTWGGLSGALTGAAKQMPQPVTVLTSAIKRYPSAIETAVYFSCLAALDNAAKHAAPANVIVRVWEQANALHFTISDSGRGFDPLHTPPGAGITNMRNRVVALGGTLTIDSAPAHGTVVQGTVPHLS